MVKKVVIQGKIVRDPGSRKKWVVFSDGKRKRGTKAAIAARRRYAERKYEYLKAGGKTKKRGRKRRDTCPARIKKQIDKWRVRGGKIQAQKGWRPTCEAYMDS